MTRYVALQNRKLGDTYVVSVTRVGASHQLVAVVSGEKRTKEITSTEMLDLKEAMADNRKVVVFG